MMNKDGQDEQVWIDPGYPVHRCQLAWIVQRNGAGRGEIGSGDRHVADMVLMSGRGA